MRRVVMRRPKQPPLLDEPTGSRSSLGVMDNKPSPLHIPPPGTQHHAAPQKSGKRWKKLKTFLKRGNKGASGGTTTQGKHRSEPETPLRTEPLSASKDDDGIHFLQNVAKFADFGVELYATPTIGSTPSTVAPTSSGQSTATTTGRSRTLPASMWSPPLLPNVSTDFADSPQTHHMNADPIKRAHTTCYTHRLGASPLKVDVPTSVMERTSTPLTSSTYTTKKTDSSAESQGNSNSIMGGGQTSRTQSALGYQAQGTTVFQNLFACAPSLVQAAASIWSDGKTYPDPEPPVLEDSSISSTSAEEAEVIKQHETSEERRQRVWGSNATGGAASFQEEQGMELIFFQEDEEDWSEFPWSDRLVQTEKMDKDIFLSFQDMGFNETEKKSKDAPTNSLQTKDKLASVPETNSPEFEQDESVPTFRVIGKNTAFTRASTAPASSKNPLSARHAKSTNMDPALKAPRIPTFPLSRTRPSKTLPEPEISRTMSVEDVITSNVPNAVDRVSSIIKSVPNVFAKLAQTAAGPSSESEILLSRSSSQVTWVSHGDDFVHLDSRPMNEIVVPSTPDRTPGEGSPNRVGSIKAIRNAIFDSIERSESEHKEGENDDLDAPLDLLGDLYRVEDAPDPEPVLLQSQSSLTDSAMGPPLPETLVRVPSDGEDHPRCTSPELPSAKQPKVNPQYANNHLLDSSPLWYGVEENSQNGENLFVDDLPLSANKYLLPPQLHPQPDTPGERRSLPVPSRSMSVSPSTLAETDDDSIGLNALASPDRELMVQKMSRGLKGRDQLPRPQPQSSLHYVGRDLLLPRQTPSDEDSDSSSENIDHLLLDQRPPVPRQENIGLSSEDGSVSSFSENILHIRSVPSRTYGDIGEIESVAEMPPIDTGLFGCACWDIPPLIEQNFQLKLSRQREPTDGLLIDRMRSDGNDSAASGRQAKKGLGRKMIRLARTTSNTLRNLWNRTRSRSDV